MEKERKLYKIVVDSKALRYPIFAERIFHDDEKLDDKELINKLVTR